MNQIHEDWKKRQAAGAPAPVPRVTLELRDNTVIAGAKWLDVKCEGGPDLVMAITPNDTPRALGKRLMWLGETLVGDERG